MKCLLVAALSSHLIEGLPTLPPKVLRELVGVVASGGDEVDLRGAVRGYGAEAKTTLAKRLDSLTLYEHEIQSLGECGVVPVCSFDPSFPAKWSERLGTRGPAMIFASGNLAILNKASVGVVGSRNVDEVGRDFASDVARGIAEAGWTLVSGGAKGVDSTAMHSALTSGGTVLGILADSLSRTMKDRDVADRLEEGRLCLCTPYAPSAGFSAGNAMGRNKLIYAHAQATVVVSSDLGTGGTWTGAVEALRMGLGGLMVRSGEEMPPGNRALIGKGASPIWSAGELLESLKGHGVHQQSLFGSGQEQP
ncbi:MAG: DNA-protecting protein DprA [Armatimonadetes bacterium]|nr:DNA-protecting protein DprA [Armatimonadota bacterium]